MKYYHLISDGTFGTLYAVGCKVARLPHGPLYKWHHGPIAPLSAPRKLINVYVRTRGEISFSLTQHYAVFGVYNICRQKGGLV